MLVAAISLAAAALLPEMKHPALCPQLVPHQVVVLGDSIFQGHRGSV